MQTITRDGAHIEVNRQLIEARLSRWRNSLEIAIVGTKRDLNGVGSLLTTAQTYASFLSVADPNSPDLCRAIRLGARAAASLFEAASTTAPELQINLDEEEKGVSLTNFNSSGADAGKWVLGYFLAVICNDKQALDSLSRTPIEVLRRSAAIVDEYAFLYVDMIQTAQRGQQWSKHFRATLDATAPALLHPKLVDFALHVRVPELDLWMQLAERDAEGFNDRVTYALNLYDKYNELMHTSEPDNLHSAGYIAWGPLALCCLAHRLDIGINVKSDYIPAHLIAGNCDVEPSGSKPVAYVLLCPYCQGEIEDQPHLCPHCGQNTDNDAIIQYSTRKYADLPRVPCQFCGRTVIENTIFCPFCRNLRRPEAWHGPTPAT